MSKRGVIYCATTNESYLEAALISAMALRVQEPEIPITLISDQINLKFLPLQDYQITPRFLKAHEIGEDQAFASRYIKTRLNLLNPYEETLFLDADILPMQPIGGLWNYLVQSDIAMVPDRLPTLSLCNHIAQEEKNYTLQLLPENTMHFNSGVMLWRDSAKINSLFEHWHQEWLKFRKQDQLALVRAIHTTQVSISQIPRTYNISPIDAGGSKVHLLHCWGNMISSGEFRQFAHRVYPQVVNTVEQMLKDCNNLSLNDFRK